MQQYTCDWCGRQKHGREPWIVALAAEHVGFTSCRREISIAEHWSEELARHPFAVHFCSDDHKRRYLERLLLNQDEITVTTRAPAFAPAPAKTTPRKSSAHSRAPSPRMGAKKSPPRRRSPHFNRADRLRARGLGIEI